jgi:hypothetical protein
VPIYRDHLDEGDVEKKAQISNEKPSPNLDYFHVEIFFPQIWRWVGGCAMRRMPLVANLKRTEAMLEFQPLNLS